MSNPAPPGNLRKSQDPLHIPRILPHEKVFSIQIGSELFRLSGASLSSDAPSYFSSYFKCQLDLAESVSDGEDGPPGIRTLYIDRDPITFGDICRHLQGYHITPRDGSHFVKLWADAQFYQLPRLIEQLYEDCIYISIGGREFHVRKDLFSSPGNSPNYFTLGFTFLLSTPDDVFPGLSGSRLLRPPSILPPAIPLRSAETFAELLTMLRGYPVHIRNEAHRSQLLRDCKYFLFKGLEQQIIPHQISHNLFRQGDEITVRLEDIRQPGLSVKADPNTASEGVSWVNYARPYVDGKPYELILEIGGECTQLDCHNLRASFSGDGKTRVTRLFEVISNKLNLATTQPLGLLMASGGASSQPASPGNTPLSNDTVKVMLDEAAVVLDGQSWADKDDSVNERSRKRRHTQISEEDSTLWVVRTGQWRLKIHQASTGRSGVECVLVAVKLDCVTSELAKNESRAFLGS